MALTVCPAPGCPQLVRRGWCKAHKPKKRYRKNQTYSATTWRTTRTRYLTTHPHAWCCGQPTEHIDHVIPRRILQAAGIHNPDADQWLQPLCAAHHSHKTRTVDMPLLAQLDSGTPAQQLAEQAGPAATAWLVHTQTHAQAQSDGQSDATHPQGYHP